MSFLQDILDSEPAAIAGARAVASDYADFAEDAFEHFATAVDHASAKLLLFRMLHAHSSRMAGLSILSALRQQRVQQALVLKQLVESTPLLGYLALHPEITGPWARPGATADDVHKADAAIRRAVFAWLEKSRSVLSDDLRHYKNHINRNHSHATVLASSFAYDFVGDRPTAHGFHDVPNPAETRLALWARGQILILGALMLWKVAAQTDRVHLRADFPQRMSPLTVRARALQDRLITDGYPQS